MTPAVEARLSGLQAIEASAGTGKTWTIAGLYLRLIGERGFTVQQVLTITFTRAATAELRERIRQRLVELADALRDPRQQAALRARDPVAAALLAEQPATVLADRLQQALRDFDTAAIFTIHSFCQRALGERALSAGMPLQGELLADVRAWQQQWLQDFWRREVAAAPATPARAGFLRWLGLTGKTPATLAAWLQPLLPEGAVDTVRLPAEPIVEDDAALNAAWQSLRHDWQAGARAVVEAFLMQTPLNGGQFTPLRTTQRLQELGAHFAAGDAAARPRNADYFKTSKIAKAFTQATRAAGVTEADIPVFCTRYETFLTRQAAQETWLEWQWQSLCVQAHCGLLSELPKRMADAGVQGFDDLIGNLGAALSANGGAALASALRTAYPTALIDEFQDTDRRQWAIFETLYARPASAGTVAFLVGDPKQAIYRFRGADIATYLSAIARCDVRHALTENHRSVPGLLVSLNEMYDLAGDGFGGCGIRYVPVIAGSAKPVPALFDAGKPDPHPLQILEHPSLQSDRPLNKDEARAWCAETAAAEVAGLLAQAADGLLRLGDRPLRAADIAVLVGTHRQAEMMRVALAARQISCASQSAESVWNTPEAELMERLLLALTDPGDASLVRAALVSEAMGLSGHDLLALNESPLGLLPWQERFQHWRDRWQQRGLLRALREWLREAGVPGRLATFENGERRLTNLLQVAELLEEASTDHPEPALLLAWLAMQRAEAPGSEAAQQRLESDAALVQVLTVHVAKGLEYPVTVLPFLWDGRDHARDVNARKALIHADPAETAHRILNAGGEGFEEAKAAAIAFAGQESLRAAYVALTRAKNRCVVLTGPFNGRDKSALGTLLPNAETLVRAAPDTVTLRRDAVATGPCGSETATVALDAAYWRSPLPKGLRQTSFTALLHRQETAAIADHDQPLLLNPATERDAAEPAPSTGPHAFPRGAQVGECLHGVLEIIDFQRSDDWAAAIDAALRQFGLASQWALPLRQWLAEILATPLPLAGVPLRAIGPAQLLREMDFELPLTDFDPARLAALAAAHGIAMPALDAASITGNLRGFVDLIWVGDDGRWWLADYKSSWLGPDDGAYQPAGLAVAAADAGYLLQALLYLLALHRWLRSRLPDYDYGRHVGGAFLLYLRGLSPERQGQGVLALQPPRTLIEALDALLPAPEAAP